MASSKSRNWVWTMHEYDDDVVARLRTCVDKCVKMTFQEELAPTTGKRHLQGCVVFTNPRCLGGVKKFLGSKTVHVEVMRGTVAQSVAYCSKDDTRVDGGVTFDHGIVTEQGSRTDLVALHARIVAKEITLNDIMMDYPQLYCQYKNGLRDICDAVYGTKRDFKSYVSVLYGASGLGKSLDAFASSDDTYVLRCNKNAVWFDGYNYQDTVIIDDFYGWIPFNMLLNMLDRYAMKVDIKGGAMEFNSKNIIITSNKSPIDWYPNLSTEHQIALLRRLDNVVCYSRSRGKVNVTTALREKIDCLMGTVNDEYEDELLSATYASETSSPDPPAVQAVNPPSVAIVGVSSANAVVFPLPIHPLFSGKENGTEVAQGNTVLEPWTGGTPDERQYGTNDSAGPREAPVPSCCTSIGLTASPSAVPRDKKQNRDRGIMWNTVWDEMEQCEVQVFM